MENKKGIFVKVEGPNMSGKTTFIRKVKQYLGSEFSIVEINTWKTSEVAIKELLKSHDVVVGEYVKGEDYMECKSCKVRDEYIEFLGMHIEGHAVYMQLHGMGPSDEIVKKGEELRKKIKEAE